MHRARRHSEFSGPHNYHSFSRSIACDSRACWPDRHSWPIADQQGMLTVVKIKVKLDARTPRILTRLQSGIRSIRSARSWAI